MKFIFYIKTIFNKTLTVAGAMVAKGSATALSVGALVALSCN
ncbi:MAG: hypothetical protein ABW049_14450 [Spongiibacteraceae bacterium]